MPYRIDISSPPSYTYDLLVELGALDIEVDGDSLAALLPDSVAPDLAIARIGTERVVVSPAVGRDAGSVWRLGVAAGVPPLVASEAFGTGHHPTTALCLEALQKIVLAEAPKSVLDVGTGSGILALSALLMGVPRAVGLDIDARALQAASANAELNGVTDRLELLLGGPEVVEGNWPVVVANVLAAPLMEMAPVLVQRLGSKGWLILSGIHSSLEAEVRRAYKRCGIQSMDSLTRSGWTMLTAQAPW